MLLTILTTYQPATDLGYLLHKHPARLHTLDVAHGRAHVFYPEATPERCTAALLLDLDPVGLVRNHRGPAGEGFALEQYVNDRPYAASSFLSAALAKAFNTALNGTCKDRPALPDALLPLEATVAAVPAAGPEQLRRLFEPLGYHLGLDAHPLDPAVPEWGDSRYYTVRLRHPALRLRDLLSHLYVLIPVLDRGDKHYWISREEAEKLLRRGGEWLPRHPEREFITRRYLRFAEYVNPTLARLLEGEEPESAPALAEHSAGTAPDAETPAEYSVGTPASGETPSDYSASTSAGVEMPAEYSEGVFPPAEVLAERSASTSASPEMPAERSAGTSPEAEMLAEHSAQDAASVVGPAAGPVPAPSLHDQRLDRVAEEIRRLGAQRVLDLGCGEGKLVRRLLKIPAVEHVLALDVSHRELQRAHERLHVAEMPPRQRARLTLAQGSVLYHDARLAGYDAAAVVEVIEHLDPGRLAAFEQVVFARARPGAVFVTTPNADYNRRYETLSAGAFRHHDHRFEWTRAEFAAWATGVAARHGYRVRLAPLGSEDAEVGAPSQLAVFER